MGRGTTRTGNGAVGVKYTEREFTLGEYWLSQTGKSPAWQRTWFDAAARQTRRVSLGTADFDEAKKIFTEWFIANHAPKLEKPAEALVADLVRRYYDAHGKNLRSAGQALAGKNHWINFWGTATVAELSDITRQEGFHKHLRATGMKDSTVARVITVGKAALNRAFKRGEILSVPYIMQVEEGEQEPRGRLMDMDELRALYRFSPPHLRTFILWMLGTAARPEAILGLSSTQVDWKAKLVRLNPQGRRQTKKYRPIVRLLPALAENRFEGLLLSRGGNRINSVKTAWRAARDEAKLDAEVKPYSLRHTAAVWMRQHRVTEWDVATQLGHKRMGVTEIYTAFHPDYLKSAAKALNKLVVGVRDGGGEVERPFAVDGSRILQAAE